MTRRPQQARRKAVSVAKILAAHKGLNLRVLDVTKQCSYADFFILLSASSTRHARALADALRNECPDRHKAIEGHERGEWILIDMGDILVHVFLEPVRLYYNLDKLWADSPLVRFESTRRKTSARTAAR